VAPYPALWDIATSLSLKKLFGSRRKNTMKVGTCAAAATFGLMILAWSVWQASAQTTQGGRGTSPVVSVASAPPGTEALMVQWVHIAAPGVGVMLAAVARPSGAGPFPTVLLLEGVSKLLICYPVWVSERNRTTHVRASNDDYASAALPLLPRDRYCQAWSVP